LSTLSSWVKGLVSLAVLAAALVAGSARAQQPVPPVEFERLNDGPDRAGHGMVYDPVNDRYWTFGGVEADVHSNEYHGTVYSLDASNPDAEWKVEPLGRSRPEPRAFHTITYDSLNERMILYGGLLDRQPPQMGDPDSGVVVANGNQVWFLDLANPEAPVWSRVNVPGNGTLRFMHAAVYIPEFDALVVSGGAENFSQFRGDNWALLLAESRWVRMANAGFSPRAGHLLVYDQAAKRLVSYGGAINPEDFDATAEIRTLDLSGGLTGADAWERLVPATASLERGFAAGVLDQATRLLWVHGGAMTDRAFVRDLSVLDLSVSPPQWTRTNLIANGPLDRFLHAAALDPVRHQILFQGGTPDNERTLRDTRLLVQVAAPTATATDGAVTPTSTGTSGTPTVSPTATATIDAPTEPATPTDTPAAAYPAYVPAAANQAEL
jgi:hypothetical protein